MQLLKLIKDTEKTGKKVKKAFTLIELIAVIVIIAILAAAAKMAYTGFIKSASFTAANEKLNSYAKVFDGFNVKTYSLDSGFTDSAGNAVYKQSGQLVFRTEDDNIVTGNYLSDISQNGNTLGAVLSNTYKVELPAEYRVDSAPVPTGYKNGNYYVLVDADTTNNKILGQVVMYCVKTNDFKGTDKYESMWSKLKNKVSDTGWIDSLKSNAEDAGYNCLAAAIPVSQ